MENKVWTVLQKEKWTEEGVKDIENLHDAIVRIFEKADKEDMQILARGINANLFEVMDILDIYVRGEIFSLVCDVCGQEAELTFVDLNEMVQYKKDYGWINRKIDGDWENVCPDCQAEEREE